MCMQRVFCPVACNAVQQCDKPHTLRLQWAVAGVGVTMEDLGEAIALNYLISLVLAYPLGRLADKFHPLRVSIAALIGYVLVST